MIVKRHLAAIILLIVIIIIIYYKGRTENPGEKYDTFSYDDEIPVEIKTSKQSYSLVPDECNKSKDLLGVLIVTSYVGHDSLRSIHRRSISQNELKQMNLVRVFLLAQIPSQEKFITQSSIENENNRFGDILQGTFTEHYRNLTYKHIMGLEWASKNCAARFIIKIDDDTVFDIFSVHHMIKGLSVDPTSFYISGYLFEKQHPQRLKPDKHYVSYEEYPAEFYPPFVSGWLYITNPFTARQLAHQAREEPFFWIDDTFITGIVAEKLGIKHVALNKYFSANPEFLDCCVRDMMIRKLKCEFWVGPNGGDDKMLAEFIKDSRLCRKLMCRQRQGITQDTRKTCVAASKNNVHDHGNAVIKSIKL